MADRERIEAQLNKLRSEIAALAKLPALSPDFTDWLNRLFAVVEAGFGINSDETHQLRAISPELPSEFYDSAAERLGRSVSDAALRDQLHAKLNIDAPQTVFRRHLYEYDDLIAAMINGLRTA